MLYGFPGPLAPVAAEGGTLANGRFPSTQGTLFKVASGTRVYIQSLFIRNDGAGINTVSVYLESRKIWTRALETGDYTVISAFWMSEGDKIEGVATNANEVDYVLTGVVTR